MQQSPLAGGRERHGCGGDPACAGMIALRFRLYALKTWLCVLTFAHYAQSAMHHFRLLHPGHTRSFALDWTCTVSSAPSSWPHTLITCARLAMQAAQASEDSASDSDSDSDSSDDAGGGGSAAPSPAKPKAKAKPKAVPKAAKAKAKPQAKGKVRSGVHDCAVNPNISHI